MAAKKVRTFAPHYLRIVLWIIAFMSVFLIALYAVGTVHEPTRYLFGISLERYFIMLATAPTALTAIQLGTSKYKGLAAVLSAMIAATLIGGFPTFKDWFEFSNGVDFSTPTYKLSFAVIIVFILTSAVILMIAGYFDYFADALSRYFAKKEWITRVWILPLLLILVFVTIFFANLDAVLANAATNNGAFFASRLTETASTDPFVAASLIQNLAFSSSLTGITYWQAQQLQICRQQAEEEDKKFEMKVDVKEID